MHVADRLYNRKYLTLHGRVSISLLSFLFFSTQALSNIPFNVNFEKKKKEKKYLFISTFSAINFTNAYRPEESNFCSFLRKGTLLINIIK